MDLLSDNFNLKKIMNNLVPNCNFLTRKPLYVLEIVGQKLEYRDFNIEFCFVCNPLTNQLIMSVRGFLNSFKLNETMPSQYFFTWASFLQSFFNAIGSRDVMIDAPLYLKSDDVMITEDGLLDLICKANPPHAEDLLHYLRQFVFPLYKNYAKTDFDNFFTTVKLNAIDWSEFKTEEHFTTIKTNFYNQAKIHDIEISLIEHACNKKLKNQEQFHRNLLTFALDDSSTHMRVMERYFLNLKGYYGQCLNQKTEQNTQMIDHLKHVSLNVNEKVMTSFFLYTYDEKRRYIKCVHGSNDEINFFVRSHYINGLAQNATMHEFYRLPQINIKSPIEIVIKFPYKAFGMDVNEENSVRVLDKNSLIAKYNLHQEFKNLSNVSGNGSMQMFYSLKLKNEKDVYKKCYTPLSDIEKSFIIMIDEYVAKFKK